jgi:PleD family two-component response regulator
VTITVEGTLAGKDDPPEEQVSRADSLMYRGKERGKNCVVVS